MEEVGVVLPEQELNGTQPAEDGPSVFINILDDFAGWFLGMEGGWGGESVVYWNTIFTSN